jgi:hypothetical protein
MTELRPRRFGSLGALVVAGCFQDPPPADSTGSEGDSGGASTSVATADTTAGESEGGSVDGASSGGPCAQEDPTCVEPGETIWEVLVGGAGHDAAYTLIVDDDGDVVVAGEYASGGGSDPWFTRFDADGNEAWSYPTASGEGVDAIRGLALMGGGVVLGVGWQHVTTTGDAYVEARDASGTTVASTTYDGGADDFLISVLRRDDSLFSVGFMQLADTSEPTPLLLRHAIDADALLLEHASVEHGTFDGVEGQLFGVAAAPNGNLVVVGALRGRAGSYDASVQIVSPEGTLVSDPVTFGGSEYDDFYVVDVDETGSGVAVGRSISDVGSEILMVHFTVDGDTVSSQWEYSWTEAPFTYANGFTRDGDTVFIATGTTTDPAVPEAYDAMILRWDGTASEPTWTVPFAADAPHRDYASDVALSPDGTLVACGVVSPDENDLGDAWIRKLAR